MENTAKRKKKDSKKSSHAVKRAKRVASTRVAPVAPRRSVYPTSDSEDNFFMPLSCKKSIPPDGLVPPSVTKERPARVLSNERMPFNADSVLTDRPTKPSSPSVAQASLKTAEQSAAQKPPPSALPQNSVLGTNAQADTFESRPCRKAAAKAIQAMITSRNNDDSQSEDGGSKSDVLVEKNESEEEFHDEPSFLMAAIASSGTSSSRRSRPRTARDAEPIVLRSTEEALAYYNHNFRDNVEDDFFLPLMANPLQGEMDVGMIDGFIRYVLAMHKQSVLYVSLGYSVYVDANGLDAVVKSGLETFIVAGDRFTFDLAIVPVRLSIGHYVLAIYEIGAGRVRYFDPLPRPVDPGYHFDSVLCMVAYLRKTYRPDAPPGRLVVQDPTSYNHQVDGVSCGFFVSLYVEMYLLRRDLGHLMVEEPFLPDYRRRVVRIMSDLYNGNFPDYGKLPGVNRSRHRRQPADKALERTTDIFRETEDAHSEEGVAGSDASINEYEYTYNAHDGDDKLMDDLPVLNSTGNSGQKSSTLEDDISDDNIEIREERRELKENGTSEQRDPGPSTTSSALKGSSSKPNVKKRLCRVCRYVSKSEEEFDKHKLITKHDVVTYRRCDFPKCNRLYDLRDTKHRDAHYKEAQVCGVRNHNGTRCNYSHVDRFELKRHRDAPHEGKFHCMTCNWFMPSPQAFAQHRKHHDVVATSSHKLRSLQHVSTYKGPGNAIPIRGLGNICLECDQRVVCFSHFLDHWKREHATNMISKDDRATAAHLRCDLCGYCMPMVNGDLHLEFNCFYRVFPHMSQAVGARGHDDGYSMSICNCGEVPDSPRSFNSHIKTLLDVTDQGHAPATIDNLKKTDLVKTFLKDNANADQNGGTYVIVQVDPNVKYTLHEFLQRILYVGSSASIKLRDTRTYFYVPPPEHPEVQYRIRLGANVNGQSTWQFSKGDSKILEAFVMLYLSLRNLWNRDYPNGPQGWLMNDRFAKFSASFHALSAVVLYGAYEEIVTSRNWSSPYATIFHPLKRRTTTASALIFTVPLACMNSEEARIKILELCRSAGKSLEELFFDTPTRNVTGRDQAVQTDAVLGPAQTHLGRDGSEDAMADEPPLSSVRSAYKTPPRYSSVFVATPRPFHRKKETPKGPRMLAKQTSTPRNDTIPLATSASTKRREELDDQHPGYQQNDAPLTKIRKVENICVNATSTSDGPQPAKSDDSGIELKFDFTSVVRMDALSPRAKSDARSSDEDDNAARPRADDEARYVAIYSKKGVRNVDMHADPLDLSEESSSSDTDSD